MTPMCMMLMMLSVVLIRCVMLLVYGMLCVFVLVFMLILLGRVMMLVV